MLGDADYARLLRRLVALRKKHAAFFLKGRFIDNRGLVTAGDVRAFGIESRDDVRLLVNLWLPGTEPTTVVHTALRVDRPGLRFTPVYPEDLNVERDGSWLSLSWRGPVATLIV
jgi:hypothetical protein